MAGSDESNENMASGRVNRAEDWTRIWAQREEDGEFNGAVIFVAEPAGDIEDDDYAMTSAKLHGILGVGNAEGVGVVGLAGTPGGTDLDLARIDSIGVFGKGEPGVVGEGRVAGVEGIGAGHRFPGIIGRGGRQRDDSNERRELHGPGVVGIGGARSRKLERPELSESVGVFGQGAEAETRTVDGQEHGPRRPGAGVIGRGGVSTPHGDGAPGVVGIAGGADESPSTGAPEGNCGVIGRGATGVEGISEHGTGVRGHGNSGVLGEGKSGRGGVFQSERVAQLLLVPARRPRAHDQSSFVPQAIGNPQTMQLPRDGLGGDLMTTVDEDGRCALWFCVKARGPAGPARWSQVLLGPVFDGTA